MSQVVPTLPPLTCSPDKEGIAIIMCESELESKYKALTQGKTVLESSLHLNLTEHLNSELALGTFCNVVTARTWLQSTFFFQRFFQNPRHYTILGEEENLDEKLDRMLSGCIDDLKQAELCKQEKDGRLTTTKYGDIMSRVSITLFSPEIWLITFSKFYLRRSTVRPLTIYTYRHFCLY